MRASTSRRPCTHARKHTQKYVVLFAFHGNNNFVNAPQCYVISELPLLLWLRRFGRNSRWLLTVHGIASVRNRRYLRLNTNSSYNLKLHFVTVFSFFQFVSLSTICWCFPSTDQNVEPNANSTDPQFIAIILQNPLSTRAFSADVQSRHLKGLHSWLQSLISSASQTTSDVINTGATGAGSLINSIFGGQSSYAYPFPFRRWSYSNPIGCRLTRGQDVEAWTWLVASKQNRD
jgi:hypothetical protein